jgi:hypothetical protein
VGIPRDERLCNLCNLYWKWIPLYFLLWVIEGYPN